MRKLIVTEFVTLDGVMEAPGGEPTHPHTGWVFDYIGDEQNQFKLQEILEADAHLLGRVTYESFAGAWPQRTGEFAEKMNSMPKYVVTTTLDELEWNNSTPINGNVAEEVRKLKEQDDGPILVAGSRTLVHTLMEHDLIDEYRLMVFPVVLGSGKRLFGDRSDATALRLTDSKPVGPDGIVILTYEPAGKEAETSGAS
jgi:dihydrofolate reductase